jgi:hypothetical protein
MEAQKPPIVIIERKSMKDEHKHEKQPKRDPDCEPEEPKETPPPPEEPAPGDPPSPGKQK